MHGISHDITKEADILYYGIYIVAAWGMARVRVSSTFLHDDTGRLAAGRQPLPMKYHTALPLGACF